MKRRVFLRSALAVPYGALAVHATAEAGAYPDRPIRLISPYPPGGGTDFIARAIAAKLGETRSWNIVVDNRPGANGTIGAAELARMQPTGYELMVGQRDNLVFAPWLQKVHFDTLKSFQPVAYMADSPMLIVSSSAGKLRSFSDLAEAARARPGALTMASAGNGSAAHIACELLRTRARIQLQHIGYRGSTPALTDLIGGHVDTAGSGIASALSLLQSGKIRPLAVMGQSRSHLLPEVPTLAELGLKNVEMESWYGIFAPAGLPADIAGTLNTEISRLIKTPELTRLLREQGQEPQVKTLAEFSRFVATDYSQSRAIIAETGVKAD